MSGYFARLSSLARAPESSAPGAGAAFSPFSPDRDIAVDAAANESETPAPPLAGDVRPADALTAAAADLPNLAKNPERAPAKISTKISTKNPAKIPAEPSAIKWPTAEGSTSVPFPGALQNASTTLPGTAEMASRTRPPTADTPLNSVPHFTPHETTQGSARAAPAGPATAAPDTKDRPVAIRHFQAAPTNGNAPSSSPGFQPEPSRLPDRLPDIPEEMAAVAPRTEIRIGTITLKVRASPPGTSAAASPPAAAPKLAPAPQFSPRRHYLRWG